MLQKPINKIATRLYKQEGAKIVCMQGASPDGVHTAGLDCLQRPPAHTPSLYCMLYAATGLLHAPSNSIAARMCFPRAASCDLQVHGRGPVICRYAGARVQLNADHVPLQPVQVPLSTTPAPVAQRN
jgi:hypothetical protein